MTDQDLEDLISDTLADSFYAHWNERDGAKALVPILRERFVPRVEGVEPVATVRVKHNGYSMSLATYVAYGLPEGDHNVYPEAALASLQAQLADVLQREADTHRRYDAKLDALEAQLAEAREALIRIATVDMGGGFLGASACQKVARAALGADQ